MSIKCVHWALNDAPVKEPVEVLILVAMAERAADDGTTTYQSVATIAKKARVSIRTVQARLRVLEAAGIITRGDQSHTEHLPANRRPVVYDLAVQLSWGAESAPQQLGVQENAVRGANSDVRGELDNTLGVQPVADNTSSESSLFNSSIIRQAKPAAKVRKLSLPAPDNFAVTDEMEKWARANVPLIDFRFQTEKFLAWHGAKGSRFVDWTKAWRNWMLNAEDYRARAAAPLRPVQEPASKLGLDYGGGWSV